MVLDFDYGQNNGVSVCVNKQFVNSCSAEVGYREIPAVECVCTLVLRETHLICF